VCPPPPTRSVCGVGGGVGGHSEVTQMAAEKGVKSGIAYHSRLQPVFYVGRHDRGDECTHRQQGRETRCGVQADIAHAAHTPAALPPSWLLKLCKVPYQLVGGMLPQCCCCTRQPVTRPACLWPPVLPAAGRLPPRPAAWASVANANVLTLALRLLRCVADSTAAVVASAWHGMGQGMPCTVVP
jgi:hypothetical protein